jgi:flagellar biosynthesis protein FlhB
MADEAGERTFQPSFRKLQRAREKGQVPRSQELAYAVTLAALGLTLFLLAPNLLNWCVRLMEQGLSGRADVFEATDTFLAYSTQVTTSALVCAGPILLALFIAGIVGSVALGGYTFSGEALELKWEQINPAENIKRLMNSQALVTLILSIAKLTVISVVAWLYLRRQLDSLAALRWAWSTEILVATGRIILGLCLRIGVVLVVIALADLLYQRWKYNHDLMMSVEEVKQEHRDMEGAPEIKARIRRIRLQMVMQRVQQEVPKADVVLVNPTHVAVAIRYDTGMEAPTVVAKGADLMADRIRQIARAYGVPIVHRPELARTLYAGVKVGGAIPQDLYVAVAEILALIYRLRQKRRHAPQPVTASSGSRR